MKALLHADVRLDDNQRLKSSGETSLFAESGA
jgi:hypothetical protein